MDGILPAFCCYYHRQMQIFRSSYRNSGLLYSLCAPYFFCFVIYPGDVFITVDFKMQETWVRSLRWEDPWRRKWQPAPVFLPGKLHGPRNLVGYSPQGDKESGTTGLTHMHTHTCFTVLCWFLLYNSVNQP